VRKTTCDNVRGTQLNINTFSVALGFACWFFFSSNFIATDRIVYNNRFELSNVNSIFLLTESVSEKPFMASSE